MTDFESIYDKMDIGQTRNQLADLGWVNLGQIDLAAGVTEIRDEIDRLALEDDTEVNYGGSEHRIWKAHKKSKSVDAFRRFSDRVLTEVDEKPVEAFDVLAIRNRPIDATDNGVVQGRWHLDSFNRQLKIFMFLFAL